MFKLENKDNKRVAYLDLARQSNKIDIDFLRSSDPSKFIDFDDVKIGERLTGSNHLYSANWQGNAVTVVKFNFNKQQRKELFPQNYLWNLTHPNIIFFYGYNIDEEQKEYSLVMENVVSRKQNLAKNLKLRFCFNMVNALAYLFKKQVFTFSVDINNVFFYLTNEKDESRLLFLPLDLNPPPSNPAIEDSERYSKHNHLFNLGYVLFELWTGTELVKDKLSLPRFPSNMPNELKEIIKNCWNANEKVRPKLTEIAKKLEQLQEKPSYPAFDFSANHNNNDKIPRYYAYSQLKKM